MRVVIPSLGYGDLLAHTLAPWVTLLGRKNIWVVTHSLDAETRVVALRHRVGVLETKAWYADDAKLNKAAALDVGFGFLGKHPPRISEPCLALDADVLPQGQLPEHIEAEVLYGCRRYAPDGTFQQVANIPYIERHGRKDSPEACGGYFQLFLYQEGLSFGSYPTAAAYDYEFAFRFPEAETLTCISVTHIGERRRHWAGRKKT